MKHVKIPNRKCDLIVKLYGLQRTGTNYVRFLLEENYLVRVLVDTHGWKHGFYTEEIKDIKPNCVVLCKNPYAWLFSAFNYYTTQTGIELKSPRPKKFGNFITSKWVISEMGNFVITSNPVQYWNLMYQHWLRVPKGLPVHFVKIEDLLRDCECLDKLGFKRKNEDFKNTLRKMGVANDQQEIRIRKELFNRMFYTKELYLSEYNAKLFDFVNSEVNWDTASQLGYKKRPIKLML